MEAARYHLDNFELYRAARDFRRRCYELIRQLPREEHYCLGTQMRRAAVSVTNNIAEGHGRWHYQENLHFCRIARGSVEELLDDFNVCMDENYGDDELVQSLKAEADQIIVRLNGYMQYLRRTKQGGPSTSA